MKRELVFSTVVHVVLLAALGIISALGPTRPRQRPQVYQVTLVSGGAPEPETREEQARVVEPRPETETRPEPRPEPRPRAVSPERREPAPRPEPPRPRQETVRRQGLGARIEGARQTLGYSYYLNTILARISDNWHNPYQGQNRTLLATVFFIIERDGTITGVKLEEGSGDRHYDLSCTQAVDRTHRLPPLPPEFTGERLRLHLEFEYKP